MIPYHLADDNNVCPSYFNDVGLFGNVWKVKDVKDPYKINCGLPEDGKIPTKYLVPATRIPEPSLTPLQPA